MEREAYGGRAPTYDDFPDRGCDLAPSCLACPLPTCRYELPPKQGRAWLQRQRFADLLAEGHTLSECVELMGLTRRTAYRMQAEIKRTALPMA